MMNSKYNIPQKWMGVQEKSVGEWTIPVSHHIAPKHGWKKTNDLSLARTGDLKPSPYLQRKQVTTCDIIEKRGSKRYELGKEDFALFCPVTWRDMHGKRTKENVQEIHSFVCDFDGLSDNDMASILDSLVGILHVAYSSFSHKSPVKFPQGTSNNCAFRVVIGLSRPLTTQEYLRFWRAMRSVLPTDIQTKDPSRMWFYPSCLVTREDTFFSCSSDGVCIDVDAVLASRPAPQPQLPRSSDMVVTPQPQPQSQPARYDSRDDRYTVVRCPASYPIRGYDGETRPFGWYVKKWNTLQKHSTGNVQCYATGSGSLGSGFISRAVDMWGIARYRFTMCNSKKMHMDCIITDYELEIRYGDKNRSWSYIKIPDIIIKMLGLLYTTTNKNQDLWKCEIRQRLFLGSVVVDDAKEIQIMNEIRRKFFHGQTLQIVMIKQALLLYGDNNSVNPLRVYLEGLRGKWNPEMASNLTNLLSKWLGAPDTELAQTYGRKWAISCVARVLKPGCKVDTMLVLKAPQGHGKGTFFRTLAGSCPHTGYSWYNSSKINIGEKDGRSILRTAWIHEMAELSSMAKKDANVIKNFLDEQFDTYRPVYRTHEVKEPRQCVFTGSTNDNDIGIFKDKTGSRRYWFLECEGQEYHMAYDAKELAQLRDMIWAEAVYRFDASEAWWLTPKEQQLSTAHNAEYTVESIHETLVAEYLDDHAGYCFTIKDMLQSIYTYEEGTNTKTRAIKPMNYENFYPSLLLRLGAELQNNGKKCRRNTKNGSYNKTGFWKAPSAQPISIAAKGRS